MQPIEQYLDSTYLKLPYQSGLSQEETLKIVLQLTDEAIKYHFYEVMIRPEYVNIIKKIHPKAKCQCKGRHCDWFSRRDSLH